MSRRKGQPPYTPQSRQDREMCTGMAHEKTAGFLFELASSFPSHTTPLMASNVVVAVRSRPLNAKGMRHHGTGPSSCP